MINFCEIHKIDDPVHRLAAGVIGQAIKDTTGKDVWKAIDAMGFLLSGAGWWGAFFELDIRRTYADYFEEQVTALRNAEGEQDG